MTGSTSPSSISNRRAAGDPVLLIHGFASTHVVNWVSTGWVRTLNDAGYRVIAFDNRGHGATSKSYDAADYTPQKMAGDAAALLAHLGIARAHVMGYSMGARIAAFLALAEPAMVATLVLGGLGIGMVDGVGDWDPIADALLADDAATVSDPRGKIVSRLCRPDPKRPPGAGGLHLDVARAADRVRSRGITQPTLVAVGTKDDIGGSPEGLAGLMPNAESFAIEGRDHMLAVGDRTFKQRVLSFFGEHPVDNT